MKALLTLIVVTLAFIGAGALVAKEGTGLWWDERPPLSGLMLFLMLFFIIGFFYALERLIHGYIIGGIFS